MNEILDFWQRKSNNLGAEQVLNVWTSILEDALSFHFQALNSQTREIAPPKSRVRIFD
jgi:hypothetical protein